MLATDESGISRIHQYPFVVLVSLIVLVIIAVPAILVSMLVPVHILMHSCLVYTMIISWAPLSLIASCRLEVLTLNIPHTQAP